MSSFIGGKAMRKVEVTEYHPNWPVLFEEEAEKIQEILKDELVAIHHIGSTSVAGLKAKPIIDLMPIVRDIDRIEAYHELLQQIGFEPRGEKGIPGRRFFQKGGHLRTHHVHMYAVGNPEIERHLAFRDYLRTHPDEGKVYGELKAKLAKKYPYDIDSYINGKDELVKKIERKALAWYRNV